MANADQPLLSQPTLPRPPDSPARGRVTETRRPHPPRQQGTLRVTALAARITLPPFPARNRPRGDGHVTRPRPGHVPSAGLNVTEVVNRTPGAVLSGLWPQCVCVCGGGWTELCAATVAGEGWVESW